MTEPSDPSVGRDGALDATAVPEVDAQGWVGDQQQAGEPGGGALAASEDAFQALASDVRLAVLVHLLRADHEPTFSELQSAVGSDSSAGFAYHLRQLDGQFVRKTGESYELTPAGRRAAQAVLAGTFTGDGESRRAS
jgi:DNA-binding HxlR family transcriptional regulator